MEQDLREMFKKEKEEQKFVMNKGHEVRFLNKLNSEIPKDKKFNKFWLSMAASIVVLLSVGFGWLFFVDNDNIKTTIVEKVPNDKEETEFTFGDLSPDLKKVENYYVANINIELAKLEVSPDTKDLIDSFMEQLNNLNLEYKTLNLELKELGPNDQTITALIENLQLRLQLLQKLKKKLNELKLSKNGQINENSI
ncbi:hypothetical protein [Maribacter hydrothermalis]|uniref:Anti-sigma factor n=1 Tax=Maribacter hydrothermalis TaxID=1836467 RepID=A0A1B7Z1N9_9FLAO|nr:hypothetical protein [Maribacter hydrothermalis]APQ18295.1 hypothetical protein BTR34_13580 [Maribacter hydrothermalis]OBR36641.1 hypothetical protein A9200_09470 [Maribacter hydrothermalis]